MSESHLRVMADKWGGVQYREGSGTGVPSLKVHSQSGVSDAEARRKPLMYARRGLSVVFGREPCTV